MQYQVQCTLRCALAFYEPPSRHNNYQVTSNNIDLANYIPEVYKQFCDLIDLCELFSVGMAFHPGIPSLHFDTSSTSITYSVSMRKRPFDFFRVVVFVVLRSQTARLRGNNQSAHTSVDNVCNMSNRRVSHGHPMDVVQSAYTPSQIEWNFNDLFIVLLASDLPTVKQFLLKQTQLKSVMFGELDDTMDVIWEDVIATVKVLKCYSGIAT